MDNFKSNGNWDLRYVLCTCTNKKSKCWWELTLKSPWLDNGFILLLYYFNLRFKYTSVFESFNGGYNFFKQNIYGWDLFHIMWFKCKLWSLNPHIIFYIIKNIIKRFWLRNIILYNKYHFIFLIKKYGDISCSTWTPP